MREQLVDVCLVFEIHLCHRDHDLLELLLGHKRKGRPHVDTEEETQHELDLHLYRHFSSLCLGWLVAFQASSACSLHEQGDAEFPSRHFLLSRLVEELLCFLLFFVVLGLDPLDVLVILVV